MADIKEHPTPETATPPHARRDRLLGLRLSQQEIDAIRADAVRYGMAPADYCRMVLLLPMTVRETVQRIEALADAVARDPALASPLFEAAKPAVDVWREVREAEELVHGAKVLLIRMLQPAQAVVEALGLVDEVTGGSPDDA